MNDNKPTAVILAGGQSRRMGRDKTALLFEGETLLERAVRRFGGGFSPVLVSVREPGRAIPGAAAVADIFSGCGPMAGLHAAMTMLCSGVFLLAADLPLAPPELALNICFKGRGFEACVPVMSRGPQPLFAWYSIEALAEAQRLLEAGEYRMMPLLESLDTRYVSQSELPHFDLDRCLFNVNDPESYEKIKKM